MKIEEKVDLFTKLADWYSKKTPTAKNTVLGKNKLTKTLTKTGKTLDWVLGKLDKNHSVKSIE